MIINYVYRHKSGELHYIEIFNDQGAVHNDNGPGKIFYLNGFLNYEVWYSWNQWHNEKGPAFIEYDIFNGLKSCESYYLNDRRLHKKEWEDQLATKLYW